MTSLPELAAGLMSIRLGGRPAIDPTFTTSIIVVGPTCAGKTTIGRTLNASDLATSGLLALATRVLTRKPRDDDEPSECHYVTPEELEQLVVRGEVGLYWERPLKDPPGLWYGCRVVEPPALPVYLGGHGLYDNPASVGPPGVLDNALFIGIVAPLDVRVRRSFQRSRHRVDLSEPQLAGRLHFDESSMQPFVHILVDNYGSNEPTAPDEVVEFVRRIAQIRSRTAL